MSSSPLYFSFRLDDESKHSALCSRNIFRVLCCSPCSGTVRYCGVTTASNRCNRCRSGLDWDVSSCRCLANADQAIGSCDAPRRFPVCFIFQVVLDRPELLLEQIDGILHFSVRCRLSDLAVLGVRLRRASCLHLPVDLLDDWC